jgi:hypothetical protein
MVGLEDDSDMPVPELGESGETSTGQHRPIEFNLAGVGHIQATEEVQESALASPRRALKGDELATGHLEIDAPKDLEASVADLVGLGET